MSAPAPALANQRRIVVVRLADAAEAVAILSVVFAFLLLAMPLAFPRLVVNSWEHGHLMPVMMAVTFVTDFPTPVFSRRRCRRSTLTPA